MLCLIGLNYKNSSIEEREKLAVPKSQLGSALRYFIERAGVKECVLLSTCNRFELYCSIGARSASVSVIKSVAEYFKTLPVRSDERFYTLFDEAAARHLFNVASGLDSMIIGESQILSQVKHAYSSACEARTTGYLLNKLFHQAVKTGKMARSETAIGRRSASVSSAAVAAAKNELGDLSSFSALVIGAGETAELSMECLIKSGIKKSAVISRTLERASALGEKYGSTAFDFSSLYKIIRDYDIIISSTDSPHFIVEYDKYKAASFKTRGRRQVIIDIAVPRDIDPEISSINGVKLFNIDDIGAIITESVSARKKAASAASKLIDAEAARFLDWYEGRSVKPFIEKFRSNVEKIVETELDKFARKMPQDYKNKEKSLNALKQAIISRICGGPIARALNCPDKSKIHACIKNFECFFNLNCENSCGEKTQPRKE